MKNYKFKICNLDCASCANELESALSEIDIISNVSSDSYYTIATNIANDNNAKHFNNILFILLSVIIAFKH